MRFKEKLSRIIRDTISNYDFEYVINDAIEAIDIEELIVDKLNRKIQDVDIEPLMTDLIKDMIDQELDSFDIEDEVLTALQDQFEAS